MCISVSSLCVCSQEVQSQPTVSEVMRRVHERQLYRVMGSLAERRSEMTSPSEKVMQKGRME